MNKPVLIVDDSRVSRMLARAYLEEKRPGWTFFEAANGEEAVAIAEREAIELVTLDVNMPGMPGLAAGERILQLRPQAHVVVLTANVQSSVRQRAEALGMHFLQKPVTEATIARLLELVEGE
ncbi:response regulator [Chitinimonas arctica]|uniref:Response regulator n=1 Tax=Chitinimonas arctica TaxID=2594795 RepID=A0A516SD58_9NEIS|nr:response regulator [Chitinimonas arctica]QDQ26081.1 response regulator [Chitinimonas arctica]